MIPVIRLHETEGTPLPDREASGATQLFIGEGGYAGSYARGHRDRPGRGVWRLRGVIFEGEPPPAPEPFVPEEATGRTGSAHADDNPSVGLPVITGAFHVENEQGTPQGVPQQHLQYSDGTVAGTTQMFIA